jgi:hypothetical protein
METVFLLGCASICVGMAATIPVPTSYLHLEDIGPYPIGLSKEYRTDNKMWFQKKLRKSAKTGTKWPII